MLLRNIRQAVCTQVDAPWKPASQVQLTGGKLIVYGNGLAGEIDGVLGTNIEVQVTVQTGMLQRTNPLPYQECKRHMRMLNETGLYHAPRHAFYSQGNVCTAANDICHKSHTELGRVGHEQ